MHFADQPILRDFDQFLDYLGQPGQIELTKDKGYLRTADLHRLNDRMHFRLAIFNPKSQQPAFPLLNTFFHIARTAQLFWVKRDKKCLLSVAEDRVRQYDALSADEKYFFLLESFWCFVDWDEAYDSRSFGDTLFYLALSQMPVGKTVSIADHDLKRKGEIDGPMTTFMAEVFQAFGFFDLTWDAQLSERPMKYQFPYQSAALSELGKAVFPVLFAQRNHAIWGDLDPYFSAEMAKRIAESESEDEEPEEDMETEGFAEPSDEDEDSDFDESEYTGFSAVEPPYETAFSSAFLPAFPGLSIKHSLFPIVRPFVGGRYALRIALGAKCYREIAIGADATLDDLHGAIQKLFDFDDDHLYAFYLNGRSRNETYCDPRGQYDGEKPAHIFKIGELGLHTGREFTYLFDFGDNWEFTVLVLGIEPGAAQPDDYELLRSVGDAPEQYPDWEEE